MLADAVQGKRTDGRGLGARSGMGLLGKPSASLIPLAQGGGQERLGQDRRMVPQGLYFGHGLGGVEAIVFNLVLSLDCCAQNKLNYVSSLHGTLRIKSIFCSLAFKALLGSGLC